MELEFADEGGVGRADEEGLEEGVEHILKRLVYAEEDEPDRI